MSLCLPVLVVFLISASIPFFARRYGKFLPADAGTAFVRSFHLPKFAKAKSKALKKRRFKLWRKLLVAGFAWGVLGVFGLGALLYYNYSPLLFIFVWIMGLLACIDEKLHVLPDVLTIPLLIFGFMSACFSPLTITPEQSAIGACFGFLLPTVTAALMTPIYPRALGGGDFKMMAGMGAWLGLSSLATVILFSVLFFAVIALIRKTKEGPYGFSLFLAGILVLILQKIECLDFLFVVF